MGVWRSIMRIGTVTSVTDPNYVCCTVGPHNFLTLRAFAMVEVHKGRNMLVRRSRGITYPSFVRMHCVPPAWIDLSSTRLRLCSICMVECMVRLRA